MFDNHIHSDFSADSRAIPEAVCEKSIDIGLNGITFTDHLDLDFPEYENYANIDFGKYDTEMNRLKAKYESKITVLKGIEVGIQSHVIDKTFDMVSKNKYDYILASVHIIDGVDPYYGVYYNDKTKIDAYNLYLEKILYSISNYPDYDNIAHFEYITRYACYDDRSLSYEHHKDLFDEVFKVLISKGKGFEINTGSFREKDGIKTIEFDIDILKRYKALGGEIVSFGSDAHTLEHIGYKRDFFKKVMLESGFTHDVHFVSRKPVFEKLK